MQCYREIISSELNYTPNNLSGNFTVVIINEWKQRIGGETQVVRTFSKIDL